MVVMWDSTTCVCAWEFRYISTINLHTFRRIIATAKQAAICHASSWGPESDLLCFTFWVSVTGVFSLEASPGRLICLCMKAV